MGSEFRESFRLPRALVKRQLAEERKTVKAGGGKAGLRIDCGLIDIARLNCDIQGRSTIAMTEPEM